MLRMKARLRSACTMCEGCCEAVSVMQVARKVA